MYTVKNIKIAFNSSSEVFNDFLVLPNNDGTGLIYNNKINYCRSVKDFYTVNCLEITELEMERLTNIIEAMDAKLYYNGELKTDDIPIYILESVIIYNKCNFIPIRTNLNQVIYIMHRKGQPIHDSLNRWSNDTLEITNEGFCSKKLLMRYLGIASGKGFEMKKINNISVTT